MKMFDDETRRRLATGWDPRVCTARDYARSVGVSERALRLWRARLAGDEQQVVPVRHAALPSAAALNILPALADAVAALDAASAALTACRSTIDADPVCRVVAGGTCPTAGTRCDGRDRVVDAARAEDESTSAVTSGADSISNATQRRGGFYDDWLAGLASST